MEKLKGVKGAIFDLDGTLLNSTGLWEDIDVKFLANRGISVPDDYFAAVNEMSFPEAAQYTVKRFNLPDTSKELQAEWMETARYAYAHEITLKPHAKELLLALKEKGVKLGVATALGEELCLPVLKNNGIFDFFRSFTTLNEVKRGKGYPDIYLAAAKKMGLEPRECAVFEDIAAGIRGAKDGGFFTVAVYDKYSEKDGEKLKALADIYISDFAEIIF